LLAGHENVGITDQTSAASVQGTGGIGKTVLAVPIMIMNRRIDELRLPLPELAKMQYHKREG